MKLTVEQLQAIFKKKGYFFYQNGCYNLNIIGIRSASSKSNSFDDTLLVVFKNSSNAWQVLAFPITTDPGKPYLLQPLTKEGTAILVPGQYPGAYQVGIHGRSRPPERRYAALEQVKPMRYVRDNNRDAVIDVSLYKDAKNIFWANIKSNIHRGNPGWLAKLGRTFLVDGHSAACQVFQYADHFEDFMELCQKSAKLYVNSFTYTLLEEKDLESIN